MKVTHVSASLSRAAGGIFEIEIALARNLHELGVVTDVVGLLDDQWMVDYPRWRPVNAKVCPIVGFKKFGYSPAMKDHLASVSFDVLHLHTLWMYPSIAVHRSAVDRHKPYVVTPNGMLEPWALRNSALKKKISGWFYENRNLSGAACLHANTEKELGDIRNFGLRNPVCIIPNGVDLPDYIDRGPEGKGQKKQLLFLGRIHPKKGLANAIRAWKKIQNDKLGELDQSEWQLVVAGWDQGGHEADLKLLATELGIHWADVRNMDAESPNYRVRFSDFQLLFTGPAFGDAKDALLRQASAFILPSFSEGLPMSVLEAWSYWLPVLMTDQCNIPEGFAANAAIRIGTDTEGIVEGLRELFSLPVIPNGERTSSLSSMGKNGRSLVERQFTWSKVAVEIKQVYEWLLDGNSAPKSLDCE